MKLVDDVQLKLRRAKSPAADYIYVTEVGYPSFRGALSTDPDVVGDYLVRFTLMADARPWLKAVWWYCLRDQGRDPLNREHGFGLFESSMVIKPSGAAYKQVNDLLSGQQRRGSLETQGGYLHYISGDGHFVADWAASDKALGLEWPRTGALPNASGAGRVRFGRREP
jgi:polysaccharide biosynthesis protein PslG